MPLRDRIKHRLSAVYTAATAARTVVDAVVVPVERADNCEPARADAVLVPREDNCDPASFGSTVDISQSYGWASPNTALGDPFFDPAANTMFMGRPLVSWEEALALYAQDGLSRKVVDIPVDDATGAGYRVDVEDNAEAGDGIHEYLSRVIVQDNRLTLKRDALLALNIGEKYARAFRGAIIVMDLDDGAESPASPLQIDSLQAIRFMRVYSRREVQAGPIVTDPDDPFFGVIGSWQIISRGQFSSWHASRVLVMPGFAVPDFSTLIGGDGIWPAVSLYDIAYAALVGSGTTEGVADALIQKSSLLAWKMPTLNNAIENGGLGALMARMRQINSALSSLRLLVLADDEEVTEVGYNWTGLSEMLQRNQARTSAAVDITRTRLYGTGATGLGGDSLLGDRINYAKGNVKGHVQQTKLTPPLERLIGLTMAAKEGPMKGNPAPYKLEWGEVMAPTGLELADIRLKDAQRFTIQMGDGVLRPSEVRESLYGGLTYNSEITLEEGEPEVVEPEVEPGPIEVEVPEDMREQEEEEDDPSV